MPIQDDRETFRLEVKESCLRLGNDKQLFGLSNQLVSEADKYRYTYLWSWLGMPIIQLPADIVALQEIVWLSKPDIIIETGIARGGSVVFFASMLTLIGRGKVIGIDIDIRTHNRDAIESHPMNNRIVLIEGSSVSTEIVNKVIEQIPENSKVMVVLDSDHSRQHVLHELEVYAPLVSEGHYLVVADTILGHFTEQQTPVARSKVWHPGNEPYSALCEFLKNNTDFEPDPEINGKLIVASSPGGYLRRRKICK